MLDIGRYLVWPPVGWLETEQPRTTSFMEYRQEQWQDGPRAKDGKAMRIRQQWVPLKRIAPALRQAVVTSEDDLFFRCLAAESKTLADIFEHRTDTSA